MRSTVISGLFGLAAAVTLTALSVYLWLDPLHPLLLGAVAIFIPSIILVVALDEDARPPNVDPLFVAQAVLIAGIFGVAVPLLWTVSSMRIQALELFPSERAIDQALDDRKESVRLHACQMMFDPALGYRPAAAGAALLERPALARDCLSSVERLDAAAAATRVLAATWHDRLLAGDAAQCETLPAFDSLMVEESQRTAMILDCALQAQDSEVRQCCSGHLAARIRDTDIVEPLRKGASMLDELDTETALLAASFGEETFIARVGPAPEQLSLGSPQVRAMSSDLACSAIVEGSARSDTASMMQWVLDQRTGCLPEELRERVTPETIESCRSFLEMSNDVRESDLDAALCDAHKRARQVAIADAQRVRSDTDHGDMAAEIDRGRTHVNQNELSTENWAEMVSSGRLEELTPAEAALLGRNMKRDAQRSGSPARGEVEGLANAEKFRSKDAREALKEEMAAPDQESFLQTQKATGMSMDKLREVVEENGGELPPELREKLQLD